MARLIYPAGRHATVVVVSRLLLNYLESSEHAWIRALFNLRQDVPYVADVLADSLLPVDPRGFWQIRSLPEAKEFFLNSPGAPSTAWEAKQYADQLLLLLGAGQPARLRWGALPAEDLEKLRGVGGFLYSMAAEELPRPEREDLESMAENFCPWTEILPEFHRTRPLITV